MPTIKFIFISGVLLGVVGLAAGSSVEYPVPVGPTHSSWPIAHGSTWNSDVSGLPGLSKSEKSVQLLINGANVSDISFAFRGPHHHGTLLC